METELLQWERFDVLRPETNFAAEQGLRRGLDSAFCYFTFCPLSQKNLMSRSVKISKWKLTDSNGKGLTCCIRKQSSLPSWDCAVAWFPPFARSNWS
jgi:hypothetical protein